MEWLIVIAVLAVVVLLVVQIVFSPRGGGLPEHPLVTKRNEDIRRFGTSKDNSQRHDQSGAMP